MTTCKKNRKGFSLLELLLAIAIIGLIILMATRYFTTVKSNQQASAAIQQVEAIRSAVGSQYAQGITPTQTTLCQALPNGQCNGTTNFIFPWDASGATTASKFTAGSPYTIVVDTIPTLTACNTIANAFAKEQHAAANPPVPPSCDASATTTTAYAVTLTFDP